MITNCEDGGHSDDDIKKSDENHQNHHRNDSQRIGIQGKKI